MDKNESIIKNKKYKEQINQLSNKILMKIANDEIFALEAASKGIEQHEPDKINDVEYLQAVADGMQKLAQRILKERAKK